MIDQELITQLESLAHRIRINIIRTGYKAGKNGAHFGGSLSVVEILSVLYSSFVNHNKDDLENRDRVILSKGHAALALYCTLFERGLINQKDLDSFEQNGSDFVAHSKRNINKGLEFSGGSLSLGLSYAVGVARACRLKELNNRVYVIVGDGELNEGLIWEALMSASHYHLNNLTIIIDHNHLQADGFIEDVMDTIPLKDKFASFGFDVLVINGHSVLEIFDALKHKSSKRPLAIIAETTKGKGISFMENKAKWHHGFLNESRYIKALEELGEYGHNC